LSDLLALRDEGGLFVPTMKSGCCSAVPVEPRPFFWGSALCDLDLLLVRTLKAIIASRHGIGDLFYLAISLGVPKLVQMVSVCLFVCVRQSFGMQIRLDSLCTY